MNADLPESGNEGHIAGGDRSRSSGGMRSRHGRLRFWIAIIAIAAVLAILLPTAVSLPEQWIRHQTCQVGGVVASGDFWTPIALLAAPINGTANVTGYAPYTQAAYLSASNGEALGRFSLDSWTLRSVSTTWVWGPGGPASCPTYQAQDLSRAVGAGDQGSLITEVFQPQNSTTDVGMKSNFTAIGPSGTDEASVGFILEYALGCNCNTGVTVGFNSYTIFASYSGATFFVSVPFVLTGGVLVNYPAWLQGSVHMTFVLQGSQCVQWYSDGQNPFGTGLTFAPLGPGTECP